MFKIVFFGTPDFVIPVAQALKNQGFLKGVVTTSNESAMAIFAQKNNIPILKPEELKDIDLIVLAAYGKLLPSSLLKIPKYGALNIHPSLLPKYRGPSPIQNTILNGDKTTGVSIIKMDQKMDHGPIIITKEIRLSGHDTFVTLSTKVFEVGTDLLIKIIPEYVAGKVKLTPQNDNQATFTHLIKKEDGYFDLPADGQASQEFLEKLDRMIRAYFPWPTAWTKWNNKIVKLLPFRHSESTKSHPALDAGSIEIPGQARNDKFLVQMEGKKPMNLEQFLNGHPDFPIKNLPQ